MLRILCTQDACDTVLEATARGKEVEVRISANPGFSLPERMVGEFRHNLGPCVQTDVKSVPHSMSVRVLPDSHPLEVARESAIRTPQLLQLRPPNYTRVSTRIRQWVDRALDEGFVVNVEVIEGTPSRRPINTARSSSTVR